MLSELLNTQLRVTDKLIELMYGISWLHWIQNRKLYLDLFKKQWGTMPYARHCYAHKNYSFTIVCKFMGVLITKHSIAFVQQVAVT